MQDLACRLEFANLLDELAQDRKSPDEWSRLVVAHYPDEVLEEIRRLLVRLSLKRDTSDGPAWSDEDREQFHRWADRLRNRIVT